MDKFLGAVLLLGLTTNFAAAQDPTKTEPAHYKLAFENDKVQVVDIHYGPHEKSGMHEHPAGVVVYVSAGHLKFPDPDGPVNEVFDKAGEARFFPAFKHKVENLDDKSFDGVYIGLKSKSAAPKK